ncbi:MAG: iron-sulfur cluster assembly scaffold protein [Gammaproteobacteria bacterium]
MSIEELYAQPILQLAREARDRAPAQRPTARVTVLSNRFCGDEVRLEVRVEEGLIREIAYSVHACVLCEASTLIMCQAMIGKDDSSLPQAEQFLNDLAGGRPVMPPAGWEELGKFEPLRRFKNRLDCVLLPLRALRQALSDQRSTSASVVSLK